MDAIGPTILVVNSGSSSVKYELFSMEPRRSLLEGEIGGIGGSDDDYTTAMQRVFDALAEAGALGDSCELTAVGHRVVHGGDVFADPVLVDDATAERIRQLALFAPLHIGANLAGIAAARAVCPGVPHVAVFDTAFHRTLPEHAREYALPRSLAREHGIRRYGFHGTSHEYVARQAARLLGRPLEELNLITLHLGNGASVTAIRGGQSVDTSMGMTPLEGLVMGTRCGDIDPAVPLLIRELTDLSREDVHRILNNESGLQGLCGERDMREVHKLADAGDPDAALALEMFCYRARKYVGAYCAVLGRVDAVVFTAGIGENDPDVRARVCEGLELFGIAVDGERNVAPASGPRRVSPDGTPTAVLVIPTDEEAEIARLTYDCLKEE
jgi:acetate kinase